MVNGLASRRWLRPRVFGDILCPAMSSIGCRSAVLVPVVLCPPIRAAGWRHTCIKYELGLWHLDGGLGQ